MGVRSPACDPQTSQCTKNKLNFESLSQLKTYIKQHFGSQTIQQPYNLIDSVNKFYKVNNILKTVVEHLSNV